MVEEKRISHALRDDGGGLSPVRAKLKPIVYSLAFYYQNPYRRIYQTARPLLKDEALHARS